MDGYWNYISKGDYQETSLYIIDILTTAPLIVNNTFGVPLHLQITVATVERRTATHLKGLIIVESTAIVSINQSEKACVSYNIVL